MASSFPFHSLRRERKGRWGKRRGVLLPLATAARGDRRRRTPCRLSSSSRSGRGGRRRPHGPAAVRQVLFELGEVQRLSGLGLRVLGSDKEQLPSSPPIYHVAQRGWEHVVEDPHVLRRRGDANDQIERQRSRGRCCCSCCRCCRRVKEPDRADGDPFGRGAAAAAAAAVILVPLPPARRGVRRSSGEDEPRRRGGGRDSRQVPA